MPYPSEIRKQLRGRVRRLRAQRERRISARTDNKNLRAVIRKLVQMEDYSHLSTITAVDIGSEIELIYHIANKRYLFSLKIQLGKTNLRLPTIVDLIPGASLYEREIHDLFGVSFEGNPDLSPLLLPDGWPEGVHPLRKEWTSSKISSKIGGRK